jgi:hypothetical protein
MGSGIGTCKCDSYTQPYESQDTYDTIPLGVEHEQDFALGQKPVPLVIISDPGQDLDDEMAYVMLRHLVESGLADVKGIITTLAPAFDRARLVAGTLETLGLWGVPIGIGSDGGDVVSKHKSETFVEWAKPYMPPRYSAVSSAFKPGRALLAKMYSESQNKSLTVLIIASLKDPALFLRDEEELFKQKTREVVIMGGVEPWDDKNEPVELVPDTANNNTFDMESSQFFYKRCQELGIPVIIVTRWAAYASKVPVSCYNDLAAHGSWVGCRLRNAQRASIESLWSRAASPPGSDQRQGLPLRCDRAWFLKTFCDGAPAPGRGPDDTIWDLVAGFMQYDSVATLASIPYLRNKLFAPTVVKGLRGAQHKVIGRTEQDHNIKDTKELSQFLNEGFRKGLAYNHVRKKEFILLLQPRWSNHTENDVAFVVFRSLYELGIFDCAGVIVQPLPGHNPDGTKSEVYRRKDAKHKDGVEAGPTKTSDFSKSTQKTLRTLGLSHVPVLVADPNGKTGAEHLKELYTKVTPAGISLVLTGSLDVAADFVDRYPKAFIHKTQNVIVVGDCRAKMERRAGRPAHGREVVEPDPAAQNYALDIEAAERFFEICQSLLVPLVAVSREFAQHVQLPRTLFETLGDSRYGGHVGRDLFESQQASVRHLWKAVRAPPTDVAARRDLPDRCNKDWFIKTFCSGQPPASDSDEDVWKAIGAFNIYNLHAILMALPPVFNTFVKAPRETRLHGVKHTIANLDKVDGAQMRKLILQCIFTGVRLNSSVFDLQDPPPIPLNGLDGEGDGQSSPSSWCYDHRKQALLWLLPKENRSDFDMEGFRPQEEDSTDTDLWGSSECTDY